MPGTSQRPQVVIVGAGFAGLEASRALAKTAVDVTLVDAYNHHCFQPLLYQVATAALSPADVAWPIRAILRAQQNVRVIMARVTAIDVQARTRAHDRDRSCRTIIWCSPPDRPTPISATTTGRRSRRGLSTSRMRPKFGGGSCSPSSGRKWSRTSGAGAAADLRHRRRRRDRGGNGRRNRRGGAPDPATRFPPHRPAQIAHHSDRGRSTPVADISRGAVRLCAALTGKHGRRGRAQSQSHRLRRGGRHFGRRPHRGRDGDLGRGRGRLAGGHVDRRRARSRRPHQGKSRT